MLKSILGVLDRNSTRSTLIGETGTILGALSTIGFFLLILSIYLVSAIQYVNGIFYESEFQILNLTKSEQFGSGRDFRIAVVFKSKANGTIYNNHSSLLSSLKIKYTHNTGTNVYVSDMKPCQPDYMTANATNPTVLEDCLTIPDNTLFNTKGFLAITFLSNCPDSFKCQQGSDIDIASDQVIIDLLTNYYYQVYFTSQIIDKFAKTKFRIHKVYSYEFEGRTALSNSTISSSFGLFWDIKKTTIDDSLMPSRNHRTLSELEWNGFFRGAAVSQDYAGNFGIVISFSVRGYINHSYRYYKKLDYILGIIGGGAFLLYMIFWLPCSYVSRTTQKMENAEHLMLEATQVPYKSINSLESIKISFTHIFFNLLPGDSREKNIISHAQEKLNIVNLIKKVKVAEKNLQMNQKQTKFQHRQLDFSEHDDLQEGIGADSLSKKLEIPLGVYEALKNAPESKVIFQNHVSMLAIVDQPVMDEEKIFEDQKLDKVNTNITISRSTFYKIRMAIAKILKIFDVFGASPNFITEPQNSSCWGLAITILILAFSILTITATLQNMGRNQVFISYNYHDPSKSSVTMITGSQANEKNYQFMVCLHVTAFTDGYLDGTGANRTGILKFFTNQTLENEAFNYTEYDGQIVQDNYIDSPQINQTILFPSCRKIPDGVTLKVKSTAFQRDHAEFGFLIRPFCLGTASECQSRANSTNNQFVDLLNKFGKSIIVPRNQYSPQDDKLYANAIQNQLVQSNQIGNGTISSATEQTLYLDEINIVDDTSISFLRRPPTVVLEELTYGTDIMREYGQTLEGVSPYYRFTIRSTGEVQSVVKKGYKLDFLFGTIGGVFVFFYFVFQWLAKMYNSFKTRAKLAEIHYQQENYDETCYNIGCYLCKTPLFMIPNCCCDNRQYVEKIGKIDKKMKRDLFYLDLVKKIDSCWWLSASFYPTITYQDLSLIYLKEKINEKQKVRARVDIPEQEQEEFEDIQYGFEGENGDPVEKNKIQNVSYGDLMHPNTHTNIAEEKLIISQKQNIEPLYQQEPSSCQDKIKWFDIFNTKAELTFNGQRKVQSICGGISCILMTILVFLVVSHFLAINLRRQEQMIGLNNRMAYQGEENIILNSNNFRFMYTFYRQSSYRFLNISSFLPYLGIDIVQITYTRKNGILIPQQIRTPFQPCQQGYLDGYIGDYSTPGYYDNLETAFCVPKNLTLELKGLPSDDQIKQFYFSIYDKVNSTDSFPIVSNFLNNYYTMFHLSIPVQDLDRKDIKYTMQPLIQISTLIPNKSYAFNISLMKYVVNNEHNVYGTKLRLESYDYEHYESVEFRRALNLTHGSAFRNLTFNFNNKVKEYTIDIPGTRQFYGLIGGVILLFFFSFSCCIGSFNDFRLRYLIGRQLYIFDRKPKLPQKKRKSKNAPATINEINNYSEFSLLYAWIMSPVGYIRNNFNFDDTVRHIRLIQQRVEEDLSIFMFSKKLAAVEMEINKNRFLQSKKSIKLTQVYAKDVYIPEADPYTSDEYRRIAKTHKLTSYQQRKLERAKENNIDPTKVFQNKYMINHFGGDNTENNLSAVTRMMSRENVSREEVDNESSNSNMGRINGSQTRENQRMISSSQSKMKYEEEHQFQMIDPNRELAVEPKNEDHQFQMIDPNSELAVEPKNEDHQFQMIDPNSEMEDEPKR